MSKSLRLVFMGTPDFAVPALAALYKAGHNIAGVYCQPPKPAGRGHQVQKSAVQIYAENIGLPVFTPVSLRNEAAQNELKCLNPEIIVVAAYGLILPQAVLDIPPLGCLNIHGSLLPRWRGAAPIHRAILAGDAETGITIMQMEAGLDTGPMLLKDTMPITPETTTPVLHDALAAMGARLIVEAVQKRAAGDLGAEPQDEAQATYAAKLTKAEGMIAWGATAAQIARQVRALNPWPGCFFAHGAENIKVLEAQELPDGNPEEKPSGTLLDQEFTIACAGRGALRLLVLQRAGKKAADAPSILRGLRLETGFVFL